MKNGNIQHLLKNFHQEQSVLPEFQNIQGGSPETVLLLRTLSFHEISFFAQIRLMHKLYL